MDLTGVAPAPLQAPATGAVRPEAPPETTTGEHVAVEAPDGRLTYAELDRLASQLARRLRDLGVTTESRVGISLARGARELLAMLAVLPNVACRATAVPSSGLDVALEVLGSDDLLEDIGRIRHVDAILAAPVVDERSVDLGQLLPSCRIVLLQPFHETTGRRAV